MRCVQKYFLNIKDIQNVYLVATGMPFFTKVTVDICLPKCVTITPKVSPVRNANAHASN